MLWTAIAKLHDASTANDWTKRWILWLMRQSSLQAVAIELEHCSPASDPGERHRLNEQAKLLAEQALQSARHVGIEGYLLDLAAARFNSRLAMASRDLAVAAAAMTHHLTAHRHEDPDQARSQLSHFLQSIRNQHLAWYEKLVRQLAASVSSNIAGDRI